MASTSTLPPAAPLSMSAIFTKPEDLNHSAKPSKRARQLSSIYFNLLPILPTSNSYLSTLTSSFSPKLSPTKIQAIYDELTKTISVRSERDMVVLWRRGFFGKGTLSRSEPAFKRRIENVLATIAGERKVLTSEEITAQRRIDRKASKIVKKAERESEKWVAASAAASEWGSSIGSPAIPPLDTTELIDSLEKIEDEVKEVEELEGILEEEEDEIDPPPLWHLAAEFTQLQSEEAFFLLFALGCIEIRSVDPLALEPSSLIPLSILSTWKNFLVDSATLLSPNPSTDLKLNLIDLRLSRLDSPFLLAYASYHHYRSLGWVVRSGVKFCTDWVLYGSGGPVGGHAEFAVVVVPTYVDPNDEASCPFRSNYSNGLMAEGENKNSWRWFNTVNRVVSGVKKTLVLLHVVIPPMSTLPSENFVGEYPAQALAMLQLREVSVRRWIAGRSRD